MIELFLMIGGALIFFLMFTVFIIRTPKKSGR